nr:MAG TPA: hypothetical protein [Caudoviricetes sp.]
MLSINNPLIQNHSERFCLFNCFSRSRVGSTYFL